MLTTSGHVPMLGKIAAWFGCHGYPFIDPSLSPILSASLLGMNGALSLAHGAVARRRAKPCCQMSTRGPIRNAVESIFKRKMTLAKARWQKELRRRLAGLPEN